MALSFPISFEDFMAAIGLEEGTFTLERNDQMSGLGSGQPLNAELASPLWRFDGSTIAFSNDDGEGIAALFEVLQHPGRDFYVCNPRKKGPKSDPDGILLGGAAPSLNTIATNNREIRIEGLPGGYVLTRGDMLAFDYGLAGAKRRAVHRVVEQEVVASPAGLTPLLEVFPHIRAGAAVGDPVLLCPPAMRAKIIPGSYAPAGVGAVHQRFTFSAIQKLI